MNNERVIYDGRPEWKNYVFALIFVGLMLLLSFLSAVFFVLAIILFGAIALKRFGIQALVTDSRIVTKLGILSTKTYEIDIKDIRSINISQSLLQKMLGLGDLEFTTAAGAVKEAAIIGVNNPDHLKEQIRALKN